MKYALLTIAIFAVISLHAQNIKEPAGGNNFESIFSHQDEMTPAQRVEIIQLLKHNENILRLEGKLNDQNRTSVTAFQWPVRQAAGFSDPGYYGISNYVDGNPNFPNLILDYNCGSRTYDRTNGYNHQGTDIFTWPYGWDKMDNNAVEVIAGAAGTILAKTDGNFDKNCAFCTTSCDWNAVYIMHTDGSVAWYGHLKTGSLTTKNVGQTVSANEYLGVVGSSGNSTGPHLHFEVYTNSSYTQLVDPWAGPCNNFGVPTGTTSWWASQQPYYVSTLNKVMTHGSPPALGSCPAGEATNSKVNFVNGERVYLGGYYRDQRSGQSAIHKVYKPDNSIYTSWTQNFTNSFNGSYWYYYVDLTNPAPTGTWRYEITYNSQTVSASFAVNTTLPLKLVNFNATKANNTTRLQFSTKNESNISHFNILRSENGRDFIKIETLQALNKDDNAYSTVDEKPLQTNYYKLEIVEKDGLKQYSEIQKIVFDRRGEYIKAAGNPFDNTLTLRMLQTVKNASISIINANGQELYKKNTMMLDEGTISISTTNFPAGIYFVVVRNENGILDKLALLKQ